MAQAILDLHKFSLHQIQSKIEQEPKDMGTLLSTFTEERGSQQDQNFSQDNNDVPKKKVKKSIYSNKKVKARTLLRNVSYRMFKQSDFHNSSFVIDILSFLVQIFNPISLDRKLDIDKERNMIEFLWD